MYTVLFDPNDVHANLLPLTYTRPVADLRVGITTIAEKWQIYMPGQYTWLTEPYLSEKYPCEVDITTDDHLLVAGNILPDINLVKAVLSLKPGQSLCQGERRIASMGEAREVVEYTGEILAIDHLYDIFLLNARAIIDDFKVLTYDHGEPSSKSQSISDTVTVIGDRSQLFIAEGATVEGCIINVKKGPVFIGTGAEVMEGSTLRGPIAIGAHSTVNMGTKIYPGTTLGPWCKVGGELNNVVFQGYSNKAHDGFLGNAVIGQWCNLGAGCVASNLKNDYTKIRLWNYPARRFLHTDLQFCGLIMGDHSKAGINTMFNTATVVGVGCNIHGSGFPRNFVASFLEGGTAGFTDVPMKKFFDIATRVMARRGLTLTDVDRRILETVREIADTYFR